MSIRARLPRRIALRSIARIGLPMVSAGGGLLLGASQQPFDLPLLGLVGLVLWLFALRRVSVRAALLSGVVLGTSYGIVLGDWIREGLIAFGAGRSGTFVALTLVATWLCGVPFAALGAAVSLARGLRPEAWVGVSAIACFLVESARSSLSWWVPWGQIGHAFVDDLGLAQLAVSGGVPAVSAVVVALSASIAALLGADAVGDRRRAACATIAVAGGWMALSLGGLTLVEAFRPASGEPILRALLVQPNLPIHERWTRATQRTHARLASLVTDAALGRGGVRPHWIVWPETLLTVPIDSDPALRRQIRDVVDGWDTPLLFGGVTPAISHEADRYRNVMLLAEPGAAPAVVAEKEVLVPGIEAAPGRFLADLFGPLFGEARNGPRAEPGDPSVALRQAGPFTFALCYEVMFPGVVAKRRSPHTRAILNLATDDWFATDRVSRQQLASARYRAIEQRLPLLRAAQGGISAVVDPYGRVLTSTGYDVEAYLFADLPRESPPTRAERIALPLLGVGGAALASLISHWQQRRPT